MLDIIAQNVSFTENKLKAVIMFLTRVFLIFWFAIYAGCSTAHEFWIEPDAFQIASNGNITATLKNGQRFQGISLAYFNKKISRFEVITNDKVQTVRGRMGDNPALDMPAPQDGLIIVVHETTPAFVTYSEWDKFLAFANHKSFPDIKARHMQNGFGPVPFIERYTRHAKALISVGNGVGVDREIGLKTEFVALTNPYAPDFDGTMLVRLLYKGIPRPYAQIEVFDRGAGGDVTISLHRTNSDGVASILVASGHDYLFDGVVLIAADNSEKAVWDTFWATLTFAVPIK
jgi:hypothetical protein